VDSVLRERSKIVWIYERNGKNIYRRPFGMEGPRELIVLKKPIYNN
jgi:hypothetical protein